MINRTYILETKNHKQSVSIIFANGIPKLMFDSLIKSFNETNVLTSVLKEYLTLDKNISKDEAEILFNELHHTNIYVKKDRSNNLIIDREFIFINNPFNKRG